MTPEEDLREEELKLETDGVIQSLGRFREEAGRTPLAASAGGTALLRLAHPPLSQAILLDQERIRKGWKPRHWKAMVSLPADKLALITLTSLLNALGEVGDDPDGLTVTSVSGRIGYGCMRERRGDTLRGRAIPLSEVAAARNKKPSHAKKRGHDQEEDIDGTDWRLTYLDIRLGAALVDLALEHSGILEERRVWKGAATLHLTPQAAARFIETEGDRERSLRPAFLPMVIPPLPWKGGRGGGYLAFQVGLIKRDPGTLESKGAKADLRVPCQALNAIQETAWRLNGRISELLKFAWERRMPAGVLPPATLVKVPPFPEKKSTKPEEYEKLRTEYEEARRQASGVLSQHAVMGNRLAISDLFRGRKAFYFPHQLDHRGRAYAIPQAVHPQSDDIGRALLEFSIGKPLGDRGPYWLAVHLANLYGHRVDKLSFEGRIRWVEEHKEAFLDSALRPLDGGLFWTEAEKPWRFLAAALEWAGYLEKGSKFVSQLPVAVDGTANGLQHLSALGRDPEGGRFTNLVPGPTPEDIYQVVADRLEKIVSEDAGRGLKRAQEWQGAIDRKLVKQPTMTTPYGITEDGMIRQILAVIGGGPPGRFKNPWKAAIYLAPKVKTAIGQVVVKATEISAWLQGIAETLATEGRCGVRWRVPTGFPVLHERWKEEDKRVTAGHWTLQLKEPDPKLGISVVDQVNGIVAHVVHSLGAAHMMQTALAFRAAGIRDFGMVHDSYAVHASEVDLMNELIRESFVKLHEECTLTALLKEIRKTAPPAITLPEPPPMGPLDLGDVRKSAYLFS